jgi:NADP-dependent 3-hydroxy acid dehydrogenase YdfG
MRLPKRILDDTGCKVSGIARKTILITGASAGIGEAAARHLAGRGARVALAARRKDRLDRIVAELGENGGEARGYELDVTARSAFERTVSAVVADFGGLDVLVNNAGVMPIRPMREVATDEWDAMIDINLKGTLYGIASVLPIFEAQAHGQIINLGSTAGLKVSTSGAVVYSATKFAVHALTEGLRAEIGPAIRVSLIVPGPVRTELASTTADPATRRAIEAISQSALAPETIAQAIAFAIEQPLEVDVNQIVVRPTSYAG